MDTRRLQDAVVGDCDIRDDGGNIRAVRGHNDGDPDNLIKLEALTPGA